MEYSNSNNLINHSKIIEVIDKQKSHRDLKHAPLQCMLDVGITLSI